MIKKILVGLVALIVLAGLGTLLLPSTSHVERSIVIGAPPEVVHASVADFRTWEEWTAWTTKVDPTMKRTLSGPPTGVGAKMSWSGEQVGEGEMTITSEQPQVGMKYDLSFDGMAPSLGSFSYAPVQGGTRVTWTDDLDLGMNPVMRVMGVKMDAWIGPDFEQGLAGLKARVEAEVKRRAEEETRRRAAEEAAKKAAEAMAAAEAAVKLATEAAAAAQQAVAPVR